MMEERSADSRADVLHSPDVRTEFLPDDGTFPNNDELPVLVYSNVLEARVRSAADAFERLFRAHDWRGTWRNGIFSYHHYHSTTHEVLGVARGTAAVQLGGPSGATVEVSGGDVMVLPAGVAHKNCGADRSFLVVGGYPEGRQWDLKTGEPGDRPQADRNIEQVPLPEQDPLYGPDGPLTEHWA